MSLLEMFYDVDTFCVRMTKQAESHQLGSGVSGGDKLLKNGGIKFPTLAKNRRHFVEFITATDSRSS